MPFAESDFRIAKLVSDLVSCNPFEIQRSAIEKKILGEEFSQKEKDWNLDPSEFRTTENLSRIFSIAEQTMENCFQHLLDSTDLPNDHLKAYSDLINYVLFYRNRDVFERIAEEPLSQVQEFREFKDSVDKYLVSYGIEANPAHLFAVQFQIYRAFFNIFRIIIGSSPCVITLRAQVWQSIFTYDMDRYREAFYRKMRDFTTLITGPSGTGKELIAQAISRSAYIPFDSNVEKFKYDATTLLNSVNLSALNSSLIESELFGFAKGAFTGAVSDREGWLENCVEGGTVFLDEIGELDTLLQVKLLRVLQDRNFQRLGETTTRQFKGRFLAATNRDLEAAVQNKLFRSDFYYRICSDRIAAPSLFDRIQEDPNELPRLISHLVSRIAGNPCSEKVAEEIYEWIQNNLGTSYAWPGNVRELEQCVRSWFVRQSYVPLSASEDESIHQILQELDCTADELVQQYCQAKYAQNGSYLQTAKLLNLDRRTVKLKIETAKKAKQV